MDKVTINEYDITSPNVLEDEKIAFISDIHSDATKLEKVLEILYNLKIGVLLIGGDLIDSLGDYRKNAIIKDLLEEFSKSAFIFISIGNHDIVSSSEVHDSSFWNNISSISNIYVPEFPKKGSTVSMWELDESIDISIINMPLRYYAKKEEYNDFDESIKILDKINTNINKYNILLCHSPNNIVKDGIIDKYLKEVKRFNLILSGHMHGGLIPQQFRKDKCAGGLIGPYETLFPKHAYGIVDDGNASVLISGGVTKIADRNCGRLKPVIDKIYHPEIEVLNIKPGEKTKIKKMKK